MGNKSHFGTTVQRKCDITEKEKDPFRGRGKVFQNEYITLREGVAR